MGHYKGRERERARNKKRRGVKTKIDQEIQLDWSKIKKIGKLNTYRNGKILGG